MIVDDPRGIKLLRGLQHGYARSPDWLSRAQHGGRKIADFNQRRIKCRGGDRVLSICHHPSTGRQAASFCKIPGVDQFQDALLQEEHRCESDRSRRQTETRIACFPSIHAARDLRQAHPCPGADSGVRVSYLRCWTARSNPYRHSIARDEQGPHTPAQTTRYGIVATRGPGSSIATRTGPLVLTLKCPCLQGRGTHLQPRRSRCPQGCAQSSWTLARRVAVLTVDFRAHNTVVQDSAQHRNVFCRSMRRCC